MFDIADIYENNSKLIKRIKNIGKSAGECMSANDGELAQLIRDQLLYGRSSSGELIRPSYRSLEYIRYKNSMASRYNSLIVNKGMFPDRTPETPNLFLSGDFQRDIVVSVKGSTASATSMDDKRAKILGRYGKVLDFTDEAVKIFWDRRLSEHLYNYLTDGLRLY